MFTENERDEIMNELLIGASRTLDEHGLRLNVLTQESAEHDRHVDLVARIDAGSRGSRRYEVELRTRVTRANATALRPTPGPLLVIAPHISRDVAGTWRALGIDYVDHSGNMRLDWDQMLIDIQGRPPRKDESIQSRRFGRAFTSAGSQVVFALLSWPSIAAAPLRAIAETSGTSLGTTQIVIAELESAGYIYVRDGQRTLTRTGELLSRWAETYSTTLAHKLTLAKFRDKDRDWWKGATNEFLASDVQIGGEAAAHLLDSHLSPVTTALYAKSIPRRLIAMRRWLPADKDANVEIRHRFWNAPELTGVLVPTPLIYADLLASGDPRQREHADRLRSHDDRLVRLDGS